MNDMEKIAVWGFRWAPPFAQQGLVRDLRVRWALEEAGSDQMADFARNAPAAA